MVTTHSSILSKHFQIRDDLGAISTSACLNILYNNVIDHKDGVTGIIGKVTDQVAKLRES